MSDSTRTLPPDIEIARRAKIQPIEKIAAKLGIADADLEHYGRHKAKVSLDLFHRLENKPTGKLVLVTAITPTPAGEGKTTTSIGLCDGLNRIGKQASVVVLRDHGLFLRIRGQLRQGRFCRHRVPHRALPRERERRGGPPHEERRLRGRGRHGGQGEVRGLHRGRSRRRLLVAAIKEHEMVTTLSVSRPAFRRSGHIAFAFFLVFCAGIQAFGQGQALDGPLVASGFPKDSELSPFAREGLASLSTFRLSNGIPVVLRRNAASPVCHVALILRGGARSATLQTAGYELLALKTMERGSAKYGYDDIQSLLDETSASIAAAGSLEYSSYSLTALDKYFGRLLPVWVDTLIAPSFKATDFDQVLSEAKLALQNKEKDPWQRTSQIMNAEFFSGHSYAPSPEGTKDSLGRADLDAIKDWYASSFSSDRIFIVTSGDFDPAALQKDLDAALGAIPNRHVGYPGPAPAITGSGRLVKVEHPQSKGIAYVRGDFAAPPPSDPDYMPMNIAMKMFSDLLFNVVREEHGAVYTPSAYIRSTAANYGSIVMYKTNMAGKIKGYIDEAAGDFAAGKVLSVELENQGGKTPRTTIEKALEIYKAQFTNGYFEKLQTNAAVADLIAQSVVNTGDCRSWLLDEQRIGAVTAAQVEAVSAKYLLGGKITWVVLGSPDTLVPVVQADYQGFNTK